MSARARQQVLDLFPSACGDPSAEAAGETERGVDERLVEAVAERVAEILVARSQANALLTVAELAARLRVHRSWVYANAGRLGALRLGDGPKAPLRFDLDTVIAALKLPPTQPTPTPTKRPRRRLLPVREA